MIRCGFFVLKFTRGYHHPHPTREAIDQFSNQVNSKRSPVSEVRMQLSEFWTRYIFLAHKNCSVITVAWYMCAFHWYERFLDLREKSDVEKVNSFREGFLDFQRFYFRNFKDVLPLSSALM